jgi:DNA-binding MarR family transcriptional regulator
LTYQRATQGISAALERQLVQDAGIPHAYYYILAHLSGSPDRTAKMTDLANMGNWSPSRLSHAVSKLEEMNYVTRRKCDSDRRAIYATLTESGYVKLVEIAPGHVGQVRRILFDKLSAEQLALLTEILEQI